jgi:ribosomal protein L37AE/L43A
MKPQHTEATIVTREYTVTREYIVCPFCGKDELRIDHIVLPGTTFGPWYCDKCGHCYQGVRTDRGASLELLEKTQKEVRLVLKDPMITPNDSEIERELRKQRLWDYAGITVIALLGVLSTLILKEPQPAKPITQPMNLRTEGFFQKWPLWSVDYK